MFSSLLPFQMKIQFVFFALLFGYCSVANAQLTLGDISGQWSGPVRFPFILILTERGVELICTDQLTQACRNELTPAQEIATITNSTFALDFRQFLGITTQELAAESFPACAESGIYPFETITPLPTSEVVVYDSVTGSLTFVDSRRPNDIDCAFLNVIQSGGSSRIRVQYFLSSEGPLDDVVRLGPSFRCLNANGLCQIERNDNGFSNSAFVEFEVTCTQGACLDL